ncbi:MAG: helix-turn-helix domain-containing protein [Caldilineaceae bacterium]|nr:helix-turn-helix domain-containing protein [Caldilineaceae bacterium]
MTEGGTLPFGHVRAQIASELAREALSYRTPEIANQIEELRAEGLSFPEIAKQAGRTTVSSRASPRTAPCPAAPPPRA